MSQRRPITVEIALAALLLFIVSVEIGSYLVGNRRIKREVTGAIAAVEHVASLRRDVRRAQLAILEWQLRAPADRSLPAVGRPLALALEHAEALRRCTGASVDLQAANRDLVQALEVWARLARQSFGAPDDGALRASVREGYSTLDRAMDRAFEQAVREGDAVGPRLEAAFFRSLLLHLLVTFSATVTAWVAFAIWHRTRTMRTQLERSEGRRSDLQRMAASLAHEINNQLGIIENCLSLMRRRQVDGEVLGFLGDASEQIRSLTVDLTAFSRTNEAAPRRMDLLEVVREVAAPFQGTVQVAGEREVSIEADPLALRRAILNLIRNALEAGGPVELTVGTQGEGVLLTCADRGPGVSSEVADRAGEPFFTTKARGMGLGLALVSHFVHGSGGRFELRNREGGGAEARLWFSASTRGR